jgi:subfamily B ATP-binding cassette protein HlyB/CyaB
LLFKGYPRSGEPPVLGFRKRKTSSSVLPAPIATEHLLWTLGSLCQLFRVPFDPRLILQRFPPPYTVASLCGAAKALGFLVREQQLVSGKPFPAHHLPALALPSESPGVPALILKTDGERALLFQAGTQAPQTVAVKELSLQYAPVLICIHRPEPQAHVAEEDRSAHRRGSQFGFGWFVPELMKHKRIWRDVLLASLAIQLMGLATPLFTQAIIDKVVVHQTQGTLAVVGFALLMFMVFSTIMTWLRQYLVIHTGNRIDAVLGTHVFGHMLRLPLRYFEQRPTGVIVSRLHGVETIRDFLSGATVTLILDLPFLMIFLGAMFYYSWRLSLIALACVTAICVISLAVTPIFRARLNQQFLLGARNQAFLTEYVAGMSTVKSLQTEPLLERRYGEYLASYLTAGFATRQLANTFNVIANALEQAMTLAILIVGALLVMEGDGFTVGMLVAFQMFASRMSQPMLRLVGLWQEFQQASVAVKRLGDVMDMPTEPFTVHPSRSRRAAGHIEVSGLGFRYSEQHPFVYRNLTLSLKPGQLTVLMGPSGSGKSTLTKLMLGFYPPSEGQITIDGRDVRNLSANELRQSFGVVPQETLLFSGTIYDNLVMANPHASFDEVMSACRKAEVHEVIERLPQGYQTVIGEHGVGLSGGQRQRIAIARALLKQPAVLIFDEATSALDADTSEQFARTVNQLKGGTTILFITHQAPRGLAFDVVIQLGEKAAPAAEAGGGVVRALTKPRPLGGDEQVPAVH